MLPLEHPDRIQIAFEDHRLVANAGLILPATLALARIHRRDVAWALTRGMISKRRRAGQARCQQMGLRMVSGGHASENMAASSGGDGRNRQGGRQAATLAGWVAPVGGTAIGLSGGGSAAGGTVKKGAARRAIEPGRD